MKITSQIKRLFKTDEIEKLKSSTITNSFLLKCIIDIIEDSSKELSKPTSYTDIEEGSWAIRKAYTEGGRYHLEQIANIFKEN